MQGYYLLSLITQLKPLATTFLNRVLLNAPKSVVPPWFLAEAGMKCAATARHWLVPSSRLHSTRQFWQRGNLKGSDLKGHDRTLKLDICKRPQNVIR